MQTRSIKNFYAVAQGRQIAIFEDWNGAKKSIDGFSDSKHEGFERLEDATQYMINNEWDREALVVVEKHGTEYPLAVYIDTKWKQHSQNDDRSIEDDDDDEIHRHAIHNPDSEDTEITATGNTQVIVSAHEMVTLVNTIKCIQQKVDTLVLVDHNKTIQSLREQLDACKMRITELELKYDTSKKRISQLEGSLDVPQIPQVGPDIPEPVFVQGKDDVMSNFWKLDQPITEYGIQFDTLEHLYQYTKCVTHNLNNIAIALAHMVEPREAKNYAEKYLPESNLSEEWNTQHKITMKELLFKKIETNPAFKEALIATKDRPILHSVIDRYWGIGLTTIQAKSKLKEESYTDMIQGENVFGVLLEELRNEILLQDETHDTKSAYKDWVDIINLKNHKGVKSTLVPARNIPIVSEQRSSKYDLLLLTSSIGGKLRPQSLAKGPPHRSKKVFAPTIEDATRALEDFGENVKDIMIITGSNDIAHMKGPWDIKTVKNKYRNMLDTVKSCHGNANIHVTELLPRKGVHQQLIEQFNVFLRNVVQEYGGKVVPTYSKFVGGGSINIHLFEVDCVHLNKSGINTLASAIIIHLHGRPSRRFTEYQSYQRPPAGSSAVSEIPQYMVQPANVPTHMNISHFPTSGRSSSVPQANYVNNNVTAQSPWSPVPTSNPFLPLSGLPEQDNYIPPSIVDQVPSHYDQPLISNGYARYP